MTNRPQSRRVAELHEKTEDVIRQLAAQRCTTPATLQPSERTPA
uniref:Uncharacterized protein n=1 Tax=Rhodococcoides fascians D188 TaxID=1051973 RepID=G8JYP2_RHOFA|nr:hypothetical protein pFi_027 [Rhodococcus fascians D188]